MLSKSASAVKLQPPGAGLPAIEVAISRMSARIMWPLTSQEAAMQRFKREAAKILSLARSIPADQGIVPVLIRRITGIEDSSRYWSVFMVLDHLRIVDEGIAQIVETLSHDRPFPRGVRIENVKPRIGAGPEAIDGFIKAVANYEATVTRIGKLSSHRLRHPHPWFFPMTAHEWHCLAGFHHWIHRRQIERIMRLL
jgi:hypothetical protein